MDESGEKPAVAYFYVARGGQEGQTATIDPLKAGFVIGSDPRCDLRLDDPAVAPSHAVVSAGERGFVIKPRFASNVYVNGVGVTDLTWLQPGDTVQVGDTALSFRYDSAYNVQALSAPARTFKPAVVPSFVAASHYAPPMRALQPAAAMSVAAPGPRAVYYPAPAAKGPNTLALMTGYVSIVGVIVLFFSILSARLAGPTTVAAYGEFAPGTVRVLAFYADW